MIQKKEVLQNNILYNKIIQIHVIHLMPYLADIKTYTSNDKITQKNLIQRRSICLHITLIIALKCKIFSSGFCRGK